MKRIFQIISGKLYKTYIISFIPYFIFLSLIFITSCKKENAEPEAETGLVTDIDNNVYKTIKIGNQWWMAENLRVKTFRNGVPVYEAQENDQWINTISAYCLYDNNNNAPGLLYNWLAVTDINNIAPEGWHIPTDNDWKELEKYLGMSQGEADKQNWRGTIEGEKLKNEGTASWRAYDNIWSTNESGFSALAGSCRLFNGIWGDPGLDATGFWWTSSSYSENAIWYRYLDYKETRIYRSKISKSYGLSIRCVKD